MSSNDYKEWIKEFLEDYKKKPNEWPFDNFGEASLQHNLGEYLQKRLNAVCVEEQYIVQYERNVKYFKGRITGVEKGPHLKSEVDITIVKKDGDVSKRRCNNPKYLIELKYIKTYTQFFAKNASPTDTLKACLKDIVFIDECKQQGVEGCSLILCDFDTVYNTNKKANCKNEDLWNAFRGIKELEDKLFKEYCSGKTIGCYKPFPTLKWNDLFEFCDDDGHNLKLKYILN